MVEMSIQPSETSLVSTEVEALEEPRESEVVVKELRKNHWVIFVDGKSMEESAGEVFADKKSATFYAEKKYGVPPKVQRIKKPSKKKSVKKTTKKPTVKKSTEKSTAKKQVKKKPLTLHKHYLIDVRRHADELGWIDRFGASLKTQVRTRKGVKILEVSLA